MIKLKNKTFSYKNHNVDSNINLSRFEKQFESATEYLFYAVITDTEPYVRYDTGKLNDSVYDMSSLDIGEVIYYSIDDTNNPYAHYTYYNTRNRVTKDTHPEASPLWFDESKKQNKDTWIKEVKEIAGGK